MKKVILEVKDLKKIYQMKNGKKIDAVKGIDFDVYEGEVFGFLGPNGAGKSTTINMLTTQLEITSGHILLDGLSVKESPEKVRQKIGVVAQHNNLDRGLTARENLLYHANYFGMTKKEAEEKADYYLKKLGLKERENDYVKSYSGGMAQRLKIARAMIHQPKILFLDEPTTGLDPAYRHILWELMMELNKQGTTIFLTTHYMEEPEAFCDRVVIMNQGEIKGIGTVEELKNSIPTSNIIKLDAQLTNEQLTVIEKDIESIEKIIKHENDILIYVKEKDKTLTDVLEWLTKHKVTVKNLSLSLATLDDVFIHLTKGDLE